MSLHARGRSRRWSLLGAVLLSPFWTGKAPAQISLSTVVNLALQNSPRVKIAGTDLARANAVLAETKEAFVPVVGANAGVGRSTGAPLNPPVIFSIAAQSLVFNFSQPDYIRAAHSGVASAQMALQVARTGIAEDATNTYIALDNAIRRRAAQTEALGFTNRLVDVVQDRYAAGIDAHIEVTRARRTAADLHLGQLLVEDEIAEHAQHLAVLTGFSPNLLLQTVHDSIPAFRMPKKTAMPALDDPRKDFGLSAAFAAAQARAYTAHGEARYLLRPQMSFFANYSRIETAFTAYENYYPGFLGPKGDPNSTNSLSFGVQINLPLLDMVHRARARESADDAAHALFDARIQQDSFIESRQRLRNSAAELAARAELSSLDHDLAQDQLDAVLVRLRAAAGSVGGEQMTPKDELNARLAERQREIERLNLEQQLQQAEVTLMRQDGSLTDWLAATIPGATAAPANATPDATPPTAPTVGTEPSTAPTTGASSTGVPTTGTIPSSLPSGPVTNPTPTPTPPSPPHP